MAGFYGMAKRLFSFPTALAAAVAAGDAAQPSASRASERPERAARMLGQIALVCGLPLALVAGAIQPLIEVVLGPEWLPTADIVLYGSLAMLLGASIASPINSLSLAEGKPNAPIAAIAAELAVGFLLVAVLVGALDETGIGIAMSVGAAVSRRDPAGDHAAPRCAAGPATSPGSRRSRSSPRRSGSCCRSPTTPSGCSLRSAQAGWPGWCSRPSSLRGEMGQVFGMVRDLMPRAGGDERAEPTPTVYIPTLNGGESLPRCLESLRSADRPRRRSWSPTTATARAARRCSRERLPAR